MDIQIIFIYCLCDEFLKAINHRDDEQCKIHTAEIMAFARAYPDNTLLEYCGLR